MKGGIILSDIVGQIALELNLDSGKFRKSLKNLNKTADNAAKSMKSSFSGAFKKIAGAAAAAFSAAAVIKFGKDCVESAASVNAANSQLSQTFGNLQGNAEAAMKRVADSSGIVQSRLQGVGTSIYAFAKTTGMDSANALSMMEEALQVTADSAAYYDRSLEDTAESLKSFLKGNYENDAALGLSCTETTRNTAANKLYGKSFQDLSESQKQLTLLQMVKDANQLSGAMGQAAREADGWENVTGNLKEAWNQLLAVIGQPILKVATAIVQNLTSAIQTLTEYAKMASNALSEMFGWGGNNAVTASVSSAASSAGALSSSTAESTDNLNKSTKAAEKLKKAVAGFDQLNILSADTSKSDDNVTSNTTNNTVTPIASSASGLKSDESTYNKFGDKVKNVFEKINMAIEPVKKSLGRLKEQFDRLGKFAWEGLKDFYNDFLKPIGKWVLGEGLPRFIDAITLMMSNIDWGKINSALDELWKALEPFAENVGEGLLWFWENVLTPLGAWVMNEIVPIFLSILANAISILNGVIETLKPTFDWLWENFLRPIAEWTGGVIVTVLNGIKEALEKVSDWIKNNQGIVQGMAITVATFFGAWKSIEIMSFIAQSGGLIKTLGLLKAATLGVVAAKLKDKAETIALNLLYAKDFITSLKLGEKFTNAFKTAQAALNGVLNANPLGTIVIAITAVVTAITWLWNNCEWFRDGWTTVWNGICSVAETVWNAISGFFTSAWDGICAVWNTVVEFFQGIWDGICNVFSSVGTWFSDAFTNAWSGVCTAWNATGEFFGGVWNGICSAFSAVGTWFSDAFTNAWNGVKNAWNGVSDFFGGIWKGIQGAFSHVTDWFKNVFSGAWEGIKNVFSIGGKIFDGIKDGILSAFKFVVNGIIDGLNWVVAQPFNGINTALRTIKGLDFWGWKPFDWLNEIPVPQIPKLAKGGLATAPTLAMVGDNPNASSDPEVISPLSKLKGMIAETQQTTVCDERVIRMLQKIYDLLNSEETQYVNNTYLDSELIERKIVKVRKRKNRRYGGALNV